MTEISSGDLRDRLTIFRLDSDAVGSRGQSTGVFTVIDCRYAKFEYLTGSELEQARKIYSQTTARAIIRKPSKYNLSMTDRVSFRAVAYGIGAIIPSSFGFGDLTLLLSEIQ